MNIENLKVPLLLVVGEMLDCLEIKFVTVLPCLTGAVLPPPVHQNSQRNMSEHMKLDEPPTRCLTCIGSFVSIYQYIQVYTIHESALQHMFRYIMIYISNQDV